MHGSVPWARRKSGLALLAGVIVVLGLLGVFAIELSNTQAKSRADVKHRVHERAVLASALLDGLFGSAVQSSVPTAARLYSGATVSREVLDRQRQTNTYLAVLGPDHSVLAASHGFTAQARRDLPMSAALALVRGGHPYGLGNVLPYRRVGVINFAIPFPTRYGVRTLLTGFTSSAIGAFVSRDLRQIPGVHGAYSLLVEGSRTILASTNPQLPVGSRVTSSTQIIALSRDSYDDGRTYFSRQRLRNSTWSIVLASPDGPLFAPVAGTRKWVPWMIFLALAMAVAAAVMLGLRAIRASEALSLANRELAHVNGELQLSHQALEDRAAELARSNEELEQFASIASHDLQEPLRKVRTFASHLQATEAERLSPRGVEYLERTNRSAARMQTLIEDLLQYSRVATHGREFEDVDLDDILSGVLEDLSVEIERTGARVTADHLGTLRADPLQMRQLLQNLLSNALKFRRPDVAPEVTIEAERWRDAIQITVRDNGIGFEPRYSKRIFRVFERLHGRSAYPGTGIGLALCRRIVQRHHGTILAEGHLGEGASFTILLRTRALAGDELRMRTDRLAADGDADQRTRELAQTSS